MKFEYKFIETMEELREIIKNEEGKCVQQVAFSTFHNALTQINLCCVRDSGGSVSSLGVFLIKKIKKRK